MGAQTVDMAQERGPKEQALCDDAGCEAICLRVATVWRRIDEAAAFLRGGTAHGLARVAFEWSLLDACLERRTPSQGHLQRWTLPPLEQLRARMRRLLQQGVACSRNPDASLRLVSQLFQLASKLSAHEATLRGLRGAPERAVLTSTITDSRVGHAC